MNTAQPRSIPKSILSSMEAQCSLYVSKAARKFLPLNRRLPAFIGGVLLLLLTAAPAHAQGCAMCNTTASQADVHQRAALRRGILVLGIPAALLLGGLGVAAYRSNKED
jgi:hypothetical protein